MQTRATRKALAAALMTALLAASGASHADRPSWAGQGRHGGQDERRDDDRRDHDRREYERREYDRRDDDRRGSYAPQLQMRGPDVQIRIGNYFDDRRRDDAREYYRDHYRGGHCPPGLARKHNGCLPPGQARQWRMGQPLPREVQYYPVEPEVRVRLGTPPAGHQFVRVASDILLVAVGTGMVIDAIQDLGIGR